MKAPSSKRRSPDAEPRQVERTSSRLHVCMVAPFPPFLSGVGDYTRDLVSALSASARITVVSHRVARAPEDVTEDGVRILRRWEPRRLLEPVRLCRTIRSLRPDVVHIQFGLYGKEFGGILGEPILVLLALLRVAGLPTVVTLHSLWPRAEIRKRSMARYPSALLARAAEAYVGSVYRWLARLPSRLLVSVSMLDVDAARKFEAEYHLAPASVTPIPHGVLAVPEVRRAEARSALGLPAVGPIFLAFGFIYEDKGTDLAIKALGQISARLGGATLVVAGPLLPDRGAEYLGELEAEAAKLPSSASVVFRPQYVDEAAAARYFAASDAVLIPYRRMVGTSGVLHRAIAAGRASITTDVGWHRLDGTGTLVVPAGNLSALAEAMARIIDDVGLRTSLEDEARVAAMTWQWPAVAQRNLKIYSDVYAGLRRDGGDAFPGSSAH